MSSSTTQSGRPKVAVFSTRFLPYSQTFVYDQVRHHQRYLAEVFTRERLNPEQFPFSPVHNLTPGRGWRRGLEAWIYRVTLLSPTFFRQFKHGCFNLVHAHFASAGCHALPYCTRFDLPLVVTFHGYDVQLLSSRDRFKPSNWAHWLASKWLLRRADLFLAVSQDLASALITLGAPKEKVRVHRLGTDTSVRERVERRDGRIVVAMVGRFVEKKGFEYGIRGFAHVAREHPSMRLRIIGDGPRHELYLRVIEQLGLGAQVEFLGPMSHADTLQAMRETDIVLVPSVTARNGDREGSPMVLREASAMAIPTIASRHAGIPELIDDGVTGMLIPERDDLAIAEALRLLVSDRDRRLAIGTAARAKMQREFDIKDRMAALEQLYDELLAAK